MESHSQVENAAPLSLSDTTEDAPRLNGSLAMSMYSDMLEP